jgi:SnoaL-like domain
MTKGQAAMDTTTTRDLVQAYYASWQNGIDAFDEARLRTILAPDLKFEGPIAGQRDSVEPFLGGLAGFVRTLKAYRNIQHVHAGNQASALYDCDLGTTAGTLRFAEFFRVQNNRIQEIKLVYDATEFRRLTAPQ